MKGWIWRIKEFAIYISEKKFNEFDDNPTIKKLEEKLDKNFFAIKENKRICHISDLILNQKLENQLLPRNHNYQ